MSELIVFPNTDNHTFYVHNSYRNNIGKIISLILYSSDEINEEIKTLSKNLCMHIAAMKPDSMNIEDLDKKKL